MKLPGLGLFAVLALLCVIVSCEDSSAPESSPTNYTVRFQSDGGTPIDAKTVRNGTALNLALSEYQSEREDFFFGGWYELGDTEQETLPSITVTRDITLVAKWLTPVSIFLQMGEGKLGNDLDLFSLPPGTIFEAAWYVPTQRGLVFLYWYLEDDPEQKEVESIQVETDITLVALWEPGWVITLELDEGEWNDVEFITVAKDSVFELSLVKPVKQDYVFEGWYYLDGSRVPLEITVTEDITLYAQWVSLEPYAPYFGVWKGSAGTYLLHYDPDGSGLTSADSLIGFFFSADEIRSFVWTDAIIDGQTFSLADNILSLGEAESANTFTAVTEKRTPSGNVSISKLWIMGEGNDSGGQDPVSIYLIEDGSGFLYADGRVLNLSYSASSLLGIGSLHLLRQNTAENGNLIEAELLLTIPIVDGKPSGFTEMGGDWGGDIEGGKIVPF
jgi:uncharacterized repeat protein (TIGR02543 family)